MIRTAYHREYYVRTAPRRRQLARNRRACQRNCAWLLATLVWPDEPSPEITLPRRVHFPILRLHK